MKKVDKLSLTNARVGDHFDFMTATISIFTQSKAATLNLQNYYTNLKALYDEEYVAIKIIRSSESNAIQQLDKERDEIFLYIYNTVKMSLCLPDTQTRQAAENLLGLMKTVEASKTKTACYATELISNLCADLQLSKYTSAITKLNLATTVALLKQKNELFIETGKLSPSKEETEAALAKMAALRFSIDQSYEMAVEMIHSVYAANEVLPTPDLTVRSLAGGMITDLQANVITMQQILAIRRLRFVKMVKEDVTV